MAERWRIALIDSGLVPDCGSRIVAARRFLDTQAEVRHGEATGDATGHGSAMAAIIRASGQEIDWIDAQVLDAGARSTPAAVAAAVSWALAQGAHLIHLSLGLRHDRRVLADVVAEALEASAIVVASSPAQGDVPYPAAYPGVIRATGDARCTPHELSALATLQADYGACPLYLTSTGRGLRGASVGAAHVSRFIVQHSCPGVGGEALRRSLIGLAAYRGPERRPGRAAPEETHRLPVASCESRTRSEPGTDQVPSLPVRTFM